MKYWIASGVILICFACSMERRIDRDIDTVMKYAPGTFPPENTAELKNTYHRGYGLYKATCTGSGCHGATDRGTDTIPAFRLSQLDNYEAAAKKHDPKNHAVTAKLAPEQLSDILFFLFIRTLSRQVVAQQPEGKAE